MSTDLVNQTWEEVGYRVRPLRDMLYVRTDPMPEKFENSALYMPHKYTDFFGQLPSQTTIYGTVVSAGPKATSKAGDRVAFSRMNYARWLDLKDHTKLGWISEADIYGQSDS